MIAQLQIQACLRGSRTVLGETYCTPPLKVANITEARQDSGLELMLMSSSPGILDGDAYHITIGLAANCHLQLRTQSYQRLFNMKNGATQLMEVFAQDNSLFIYLPHPAVPHGESIFTATNNIYLGNNCRLVWGEILTCGRKLNKELFQCTRYHNKTSIFINNKLVIKENLLIEPAAADPQGIGQLEGYTHQASLILLDEQVRGAAIKDEVFTFLNNQQGISFGVTAAVVPGIIIRIHGNKAEQLFTLLHTIAGIFTAAIDGQLLPN